MTAGRTPKYKYRNPKLGRPRKYGERVLQSDICDKKTTRPSKKTTLALVYRVKLRSLLIKAYIARYPDHKVFAGRDDEGNFYTTGALMVACHIVETAFPQLMRKDEHKDAVKTWLLNPTRAEFPYRRDLVSHAESGDASLDDTNILDKIVNSVGYI